MCIRRLVVICLSGVSVLVQSFATVVLSESFDYPDGILQHVSEEKWTGHSGAEGQADVSKGLLVLTSVESQDVNAALEGQPYSAGGEPFLFYGFTVRFTELPSGRGSYFAHFKNARSGFRGRIWAQSQEGETGAYRLGISSSSGSAPAEMHEENLFLEEDYRIVCRLSVADSIATLWVNPTTQESPGVSTDAGSDLAIAAFAFRQASGIGSVMVDDLLVGTEFGDVASAAEQGLTVEIPPADSVVPAIVAQPKAQSVLSGDEVLFSVLAVGIEPLSYQWRFNDSDILDATNPSFQLSSVGLSQQGDYRVVVSNDNGSATSAAATLTIVEPPMIADQPPSLTIRAGQDIALTVTALGTEPFTYQWNFNGETIKGANSASLVLSSVSIDQAGEYSVSVSNEGGEVTSDPSRLTVVIPRPPEILYTNSLENLVRPGDMLVNTFSEHVLRPNEKLTMGVLVTDPKGENISIVAMTDVLPASARWEFSEADGPEWSGEFIFEPSVEDEGARLDVWLESQNFDGTSRVEWQFYVPTKEEQGIVVSEFLANPSSTDAVAHFNPLNRIDPAPNPSSNDEFIELLNLSDYEIDLNGWTLSDTITIRHQFEGSVLMVPYQAIIVYGGPLEGAIPTLDVPVFPANGGVAGLALNNSGGDLIMVRNASGNLINRIVYTSLPSDGSLARFPDLNSDFTDHAGVGPLLISPGVTVDGLPFSVPVIPVTEVSEPIVLRMSTGFGLDPFIEWNADPARTYSVLEAEVVTGPFVPLASGLNFADAAGSYEDDRPVTATRFYRVSSP